MVCKCHAPFQLANHDWVDSNGSWGPRRSYDYFNNWCLAILQCLCANHDIKLLTNGELTKELAWYITFYSTKKKAASSNTSALLANTYAFHCASEPNTVDLSSLNKKLIQHCANTLSQEQEISGPECYVFPFALLYADTSDCLLPSLPRPLIGLLYFYDLILLVQSHLVASCSVRYASSVAIQSPMYDTHLQATHTTTSSIGGVQIPIYLVSNTTDSL